MALQTSYTYRGWNVEFIYPPIPFRGCDWQATHPDYDGEDDNRMVHGSSRAEVQAEIDVWIEENSTNNSDSDPVYRAKAVGWVLFGLLVVWGAVSAALFS